MIARLPWIVTFVLWLAGGIVGCDDDPGPPEVVVYVSADRAVAIPILQAFTLETGIAVRPLFDTEATKTTGLANRIQREKERPRADVFWSSEPFAVEQLAAEGLLSPVNHALLESHPDHWRRPDGRWHAFAGRARVIAFDPERVPIEERPRFWSDLADPKWRDRIAMADPRFGTTRGHVGAIAAAGALGPGGMTFEEWTDAIARNRVRIMPGGNAATADAVVRGEVLLGLTDSDDVLVLLRRGVRIAAVAPRHLAEGVAAGGTMLIPNAAGMITGSQRPELASRLVAYLASAGVEEMLLHSPSGNLPVAHPEILSAEIPLEHSIVAPDPWAVSIPEVAVEMDRAVDAVMDSLAGGENP